MTGDDGDSDDLDDEFDNDEIDGDEDDEDEDEEILGVDSTNGHAPVGGIGEFITEEPGSSAADLATGEPPLDFGEPNEEADDQIDISGQIAGDEPEE